MCFDMTDKGTGNIYLASGDRLISALYPSLYPNMLVQDLVPPTERHFVFSQLGRTKVQCSFIL